MNASTRRPSSFAPLMRKVMAPRQQPIASRGLLERLHAAIPHLADAEIDARPGTVRATLEVRWYVHLGLGLWHRAIKRRAQAVMDDSVAAGFTGTVRFATVRRAGAR